MMSATEPRSRRFSRRKFLKSLGGVAVALSGIVGYARLLEPNWVDIERITLPLRGLPAHLDGLRIVQLSDIHLSRYAAPDELFDSVQRINRLAPDLVMLTGDYISGRRHEGPELAVGLIEPLRKLEMPAYAVYGNHDIWTGLENVEKALAETSVGVLRNRAAQVADGLWFSGVDDVWSGRPDLRAALADAPSDEITLLLAHEPDYFDTVVAQQAPVAAQFSGHSHGGQVRLPTLRPQADGRRSYAPVLPRHGKKYPIGLRQIDGRYLYTNRGIGLWPVLFRWNCRPEITEFTLTGV